MWCGTPTWHDDLDEGILRDLRGSVDDLQDVRWVVVVAEQDESLVELAETVFRKLWAKERGQDEEHESVKHNNTEAY